MRGLRLVALALCALSLVAVACGSDEPEALTGPTSDPGSATAPPWGLEDVPMPFA
jgi:hypothetical protein